MKRIAMFFLLLIFLATLTWAQRTVTVDDTMKYRTPGAVEISPDGHRAVFTVSEADFDENIQRSNLFLVDLDHGGAVQLTRATKGDESPHWSADGKWIAFISGRDVKPASVGKRQVWVISPDGGEAWQLTHGKFTVSALSWAPDGKHIAILATNSPTEEEEKRKKDKDDYFVVDRDTKMAQLLWVSVPDGNAETLYSGPGHVTAVSVSQSGGEIAFAVQPTPKVPDNFHSVMNVLTVNDKKSRVVGPANASCTSPEWAANGKMLAFECGSQLNWSANSSIYVVNAAEGKAVADSHKFDETPTGHHWSDDSSSIYFTANKGLSGAIYSMTLDGAVKELHAGFGVDRNISVAKGRIAWIWESPTEAAEVVVSGLDKLAPRKVTDLNPDLKDLKLGRSEVFQWKNTKDGLSVEGLVVYPADYQLGKKYPMLMVIHGGPAGQYNATFSLRRGSYPIQVYASQGYVVFMPNPRGSGGYGEKFRNLNHKDWGGMDYWDDQQGIDSLIAKGIADTERLGVMGWSYGGYMTSWTITQTSRFKAASVGAGVTDLFSMWGTTDIPPFMVSYFDDFPWAAQDYYHSHSAMTFVNKITTPTLIQHGMDDERVPMSQDVELYTALRALGKDVEMVEYPRQHHGFTEPRHQRDSMVRNLEWFEQYVMGHKGTTAKWHSAQ